MIELLKRYPKIELPYDKMNHKEVHSQQYMICPVGFRATIWITYYGNKNVALLTLYNRQNRIQNQAIITLCFNSTLANGTLLCGTYFITNGIKCFACENVLKYNNKHVQPGASFSLLKTILEKHINQSVYNSAFVLIALPVIVSTLKEVSGLYASLPYKISHVRSIQKNIVTRNIFKIKLKSVVLEVTPDVEADIYHLHSIQKNTNNLVYHGIAAIQTYKNSVYLNNLFRNIKENNNLDLLEESDDDEDFENIDENKYVDLTKKYLMRCEYRPRFKKWEPIAISNATSITPTDIVNRLEK